MCAFCPSRCIQTLEIKHELLSSINQAILCHWVLSWVYLTLISCILLS